MSTNKEQMAGGSEPGDGSLKKDPARRTGVAYPTDGREVGDWKSWYAKEGEEGITYARRCIRKESIYLLTLMIAVPSAILAVWLRYPEKFIIQHGVSYSVFQRYSFAYLGGMFGGVLFASKWLVRCVAKNIWNADRCLWRLFTPWGSGTLSCMVICLISSGVILIFNKETVSRPDVSLGIGFLIGCFSDSAIAKLSEVAETLFGKVQPKQSEPNDTNKK